MDIANLIVDRVEAKINWIQAEGRSSTTYDMTFVDPDIRDAVVEKLRQRSYQVNYLSMTRNLSIRW